MLAYSDGSYRSEKGTKSATYGWVVRGLKGAGMRRYENMCGGGRVHGAVEDLHSTRAEHHGALAVLMACVDEGWRWGIEIRLDNQGVVSRMDANRVNDKWLRGMNECEWMRATDPDVNMEMEAWRERLKRLLLRGHV